MKRIEVEKLTHEAFSPFGNFANLINPSADKIGEEPVEFFPDMVQLHVAPGNMLGYSTTRCLPRPFVVDILEYHTNCWEAVMPLDNPIILQVAPAASNGGKIPLDKLRAFYVPVGTVVLIKAGVWHWGPFPVENKVSNVLINLPERTYANDCVVYNIEESDRIEIIY